MEEIKRNRRIILVATAAAILSLVAVYVDQVGSRYTAEKWQKNPADRWEMADDIVRTNVMMNSTFAEILEKLGEPTGIGKPDSSISAFKTINYFLGVDDISGMNGYLCLDMQQDEVVLVYKFFAKGIE